MRWRPTTREERQTAWLWGAVIVCSLLLRPFWLALAPLMPECPFRAITGIPCPTCGTTHAAVALLKGHLTAALAANPLAVLAAAAAAVGGLIAPLWAMLRLPVLKFPTPLPGWARAAMLAMIAINWVWLIFSG